MARAEELFFSVIYSHIFFFSNQSSAGPHGQSLVKVPQHFWLADACYVSQTFISSMLWVFLNATLSPNTQTACTPQPCRCRPAVKVNSPLPWPSWSARSRSLSCDASLSPKPFISPAHLTIRIVTNCMTSYSLYHGYDLFLKWAPERLQKSIFKLQTYALGRCNIKQHVPSALFAPCLQFQKLF